MYIHIFAAGSVIRMMSHILTENVFHKGLKEYLKQKYVYLSHLYDTNVEFSLWLEACNEFSFELAIVVIQYK